MIDSVPVITVDGPGGAGKGTISRLLAARLGWTYLDSGALYRVLAHAALQHGVELLDADAVAALAPALRVRFVSAEASEEPRIEVNGEDVGDALRTEASGNAASRIAALPAVRAALLEWQRRFCQPPGLVADGRDMGAVVFPAARLKIFLTASADSRALRRYKQLKEKGMGANLMSLSKDIAERDRRDRERSVAPLAPADDAIVIDSTDLTILQVLDNVTQLARTRVGLPSGQ